MRLNTGMVVTAEPMGLGTRGQAYDDFADSCVSLSALLAHNLRRGSAVKSSGSLKSDEMITGRDMHVTSGHVPGDATT